MSTATTQRPTSAVQQLPPHGPLPALTVAGLRWPGPGRPPGPVTLLSIGIAALIAGISLPLDRPGIGWLITAVAGAIALVVAQAFPDPPLAGAPVPLVVRPPAPQNWDRFAWGSATVALLAVGAFRSADWLFTLCVLVAALTATLAVTGGRSIRAIVAGCLAAPVAAVRALPWLRAGIERIRRKGKPGAGIRIGATIAVSVALLVVFGALFASADSAFAHALLALAPTTAPTGTIRWVFVFAVTAVILGATAYVRAAPPDASELDRTEGRTVKRLEWAVPLGLLVLLFASFVAVQLTVLFGGESHVLGTRGLTYAGYARGGFWQLCFVTALTLVVLAGAARWAPRRTATDRTVLRAILGSLAALTLIVVASALLRIYLYTQTYGLTRLRLLVACCEGWFGVVLVMVMIAGVTIRAPWLPRAAVAAGVLALLGLAGANPDGMIAANNIRLDRPIDWDYLATLSPDAVPALTGIADPARRACVIGDIRSRMRIDDWRGWNLDRERAREALLGMDAYACS